MPTIKPAKSHMNGGSTKRFSLVPALAQKQMHEALAALLKVRAGAESGAEVAEVALCLTLGKDDPVILACGARGARKVRKDGIAVESKTAKVHGGVLSAATMTAVAALLNNPKATALVCGGQLDGGDECRQDYRRAFSFAARHKLPILYLVANGYLPRRKQKLDLRKLHEEFGIPVFSVDASDAIAAYRIGTEAVHNARYQRGPCVIEALSLEDKRNGTAKPLELLRGYMELHGNWPL